MRGLGQSGARLEAQLGIKDVGVREKRVRHLPLTKSDDALSNSATRRPFPIKLTPAALESHQATKKSGAMARVEYTWRSGK